MYIFRRSYLSFTWRLINLIIKIFFSSTVLSTNHYDLLLVVTRPAKILRIYGSSPKFRYSRLRCPQPAKGECTIWEVPDAKIQLAKPLPDSLLRHALVTPSSCSQKPGLRDFLLCWDSATHDIRVCDSLDPLDHFFLLTVGRGLQFVCLYNHVCEAHAPWKPKWAR